MLAAITYTSLRKETALFLIDINTLKEFKYNLPDGEGIGYRSFIEGGDGHLYFGTARGCIYRFDMKKKQFVELACPFTDDKYRIMAMLYSSDDKVYLGVYPSGEFCELDLKNDCLKKFNPLPDKGMGNYLTDFLELPDLSILLLITGANPGIFLYNPLGNKIISIYTGDPDNEARGFFCGFLDHDRLIINYTAAQNNRARVFNWKNAAFEEDLFKATQGNFISLTRAEDCFYGVGYPSGKIYKIKDGRSSLAIEGFPNGNFLGKIHHVEENEFMGMGDNGLL